MTPSNAILATLLVPGAAHAALGKPLRGVLAFVVTVGMFWCGYAILGDRLFHSVLFEPFSLLARVFEFVPLNLLPESFNLGCTIIVNLLRDVPVDPAAHDEALRALRATQPGEHLGFFLTGCSGIVAVLFAADAHGLAFGQGPRPQNRVLMAGLSWLLPGSGHVLAGHRNKGILMGGAVVVMFILGLLASSGLAVDRGHHDAYWIVQSLFGGGALVSALWLGPMELTDSIPSRYNLGITLTAVAGLMNLVVMVDAYTVTDLQKAKVAN